MDPILTYHIKLTTKFTKMLSKVSLRHITTSYSSSKYFWAANILVNICVWVGKIFTAINSQMINIFFNMVIILAPNIAGAMPLELSFGGTLAFSRKCGPEEPNVALGKAYETIWTIVPFWVDPICLCHFQNKIKRIRLVLSCGMNIIWWFTLSTLTSIY